MVATLQSDPCWVVKGHLQGDEIGSCRSGHGFVRGSWPKEEPL